MLRSIAAAVGLSLILSGCGLLAQTGLIPDKYKGSFIRGDGYAKLCDLGGGHYDNSGRGSCPDFKLSELF